MTILVTTGGLLVRANSFVEDQVSTQLTTQNIYFPEAGSETANDTAVKGYIAPYLGQQVTTGEQARVFAEHYIAAHIEHSAAGRSTPGPDSDSPGADSSARFHTARLRMTDGRSPAERGPWALPPSR